MPGRGLKGTLRQASTVLTLKKSVIHQENQSYKHLIVIQSRMEVAICWRDTSKVCKGFTPSVAVFKALSWHGWSQVTSWSPPSVLWQHCWAQGSSPVTSHVKCTGLDMTWHQSQLSLTMYYHTSFDRYLSLPEPVVCEVGRLYLPPSKLDNIYARHKESPQQR